MIKKFLIRFNKEWKDRQMKKDDKMDGTRIMRGVELSDEYVELYKKSHTYDMEYKINYNEYLIINNIFDRPFSALIPCCGTLGYASLLSNAKKITGIDLSQKMLDMAREINKDKNLNLELIKDDIYNFPHNCKEKFDFIEIPSLGSYFPFDIELIQKYFDMLETGGVILIKTLVILAEDIFGGKNLIFRLYYSLKRFCIFDIYYKLFKKERLCITTGKVNEGINSFLRMNKNSKVLMKYIIKRLNQSMVIYHIFLKKE